MLGRLVKLALLAGFVWTGDPLMAGHQAVPRDAKDVMERSMDLLAAANAAFARRERAAMRSPTTPGGGPRVSRDGAPGSTSAAS